MSKQNPASGLDQSQLLFTDVDHATVVQIPDDCFYKTECKTDIEQLKAIVGDTISDAQVNELYEANNKNIEQTLDYLFNNKELFANEHTDQEDDSDALEIMFNSKDNHPKQEEVHLEQSISLAASLNDLQDEEENDIHTMKSCISNWLTGDLKDMHKVELKNGEKVNLDIESDKVNAMMQTDEELAKLLQEQFDLEAEHASRVNSNNNSIVNQNSDAPFTLTESWNGADEITIDEKKLKMKSQKKLLKIAKSKGKRKTDVTSGIKIYKVIKPTFLANFEAKRLEFQKKYPQFYLKHRRTPVLAYHATKPSHVDSIMHIGLQKPDGGKVQHETDSGWYGNGIYLTPDINVARQYGNRILVCSVLLGKSYKCKLPGTQKTLKPGYDSHKEPIFNFFFGREYIVFNASQVLPCYLIEFPGSSDIRWKLLEKFSF